MRVYGTINALVFFGFALSATAAAWHFLHGRWWYGVWSLLAVFALPRAVVGLFLLLGRRRSVHANMPIAMARAFGREYAQYEPLAISAGPLAGNRAYTSGLRRETLILVVCVIPMVLAAAEYWDRDISGSGKRPAIGRAPALRDRMADGSPSAVMQYRTIQPEPQVKKETAQLTRREIGSLVEEHQRKFAALNFTGEFQVIDVMALPYKIWQTYCDSNPYCRPGSTVEVCGADLNGDDVSELVITFIPGMCGAVACTIDVWARSSDGNFRVISSLSGQKVALARTSTNGWIDLLVTYRHYLEPHGWEIRTARYCWKGFEYVEEESSPS